MPTPEEEHTHGLHEGKQRWMVHCRLCVEELARRQEQARDLHMNRTVQSMNDALEALSHHPEAQPHILEAERLHGIRTMLRALGEDPDREGLRATPKRVIKAWGELCKGYSMKVEDFMTVFDGESYDQMITVGPVRFYSTCEHHLLPFYGDAWLGYVPDGRIVGLSKLPRVVEMFSRRLQNQERMTQQIADALFDAVKAKGAACIVKGQHLCMMARGVRQEAASMTTSALRGVFMEPAVRQEFFSLCK